MALGGAAFLFWGVERVETAIVTVEGKERELGQTNTTLTFYTLADTPMPPRKNQKNDQPIVLTAPRVAAPSIVLTKPKTLVISPTKKVNRDARTEHGRVKRKRVVPPVVPEARGKVTPDHAIVETTEGGDAPDWGDTAGGEGNAELGGGVSSGEEEVGVEGGNGYDLYEEWVRANCVVFSQIASNICVAEGWNPIKKETTVSGRMLRLVSRR